jgi:predicted DsbA family dithiol-disulfide isomerase
MIDAAPGTIVVYSDVACPWATLAVHRLWRARARAGLEGAVAFDHRAFPLEIVNGRPTSRALLDAEIPVVGGAAPGFGWQTWQGDPSAYPATVLLPLEAVQAAKAQSLEASAELDLALRRAFFGASRPIGLRHVILECAVAAPEVDAYALEEALDDGRARRAVMEQAATAEADDDVKGSPTVFLSGGVAVHNPGVTMHWEGVKPSGFPVITADDPSVYDALVRQAAGAAA